ncbi:hypothetical protein [uncultured Microbacterium sp.]|uniref:hypothetical protein n=1 Tax=uncultured Microbacterium sp. TaxID=191216 RepID=UPI002606517E|nr:hypothetical protein [uncultured Microbacterium sp.]
MTHAAGFALPRLARLVRESVERMEIDLADREVLTEAATGAYLVTPVVAALSGARVTAITKATRYGSVDDVTSATSALAHLLGVADRIRVTGEHDKNDFARADVITNSGHVRPIVGAYADAIRDDAVVSLMFETWEIQAGRVDLDIDGLLRRGVRVAGTNERHPFVDVFSYLGIMAVIQLADAGVPAYGSTIALCCDNPFNDYIVHGLEAAGARVVSARSLDGLDVTAADALLVAITPTGGSVLSDTDVARLATARPDLVVVRYWGDISTDTCDTVGLSVWPRENVSGGHMAVLPSRVGPDAIVRLQAGGLKVGELLLREPASLTSAERRYIDEL